MIDDVATNAMIDVTVTRTRTIAGAGPRRALALDGASRRWRPALGGARGAALS